jgi:hypothetical protein
VLYFNNEQLLNDLFQRYLRRSYGDTHNPMQLNIMHDCLFVLESLLSNFESRFEFRAALARKLFRRLFIKDKKNSGNAIPGREAGISALSVRIAENTDLAGVVDKRRENYAVWLSCLSQWRGVDFVVKGLPEGVSPLTCAVIAEDPSGFLDEMVNKGIPAFYWPTYLPEEVNNNPRYPNANYLARHLVTLPVHQGINSGHLRRIVIA